MQRRQAPVPDDEMLLDLSAWPSPPTESSSTTPPVRRAVLPPRPAPRRRLPSLSLGKAGVAALAAGAAALLLPVPGTGCPSALSSWTTIPKGVPVPPAPKLDEGLVTADQEAVAAAQAAIARHDVQVTAAQHVLRLPTAVAPTTTRVIRSQAASAATVAALQRAVRNDEADRDRAKAARDALVTQQQESDDPASYDGDVAAAQEDLDVAEARLSGDRSALAAATKVTISVVRAAGPSAAPAGPTLQARTTVARAAVVAAALRRELTAAQQTQAAHLAARRAELATWSAAAAKARAESKAQVAKVAACQGKASVPGALGAGLAVLGAGFLVVRRLRSRR